MRTVTSQSSVVSTIFGLATSPCVDISRPRNQTHQRNYRVLGLSFGLGLGGFVEVSRYVYRISDVCAGRHGNSCYIVVNEELTWQQASNRCQAMGGHLATIESKEENEAVRRIVASKFPMYFVI